MMYVFYYFLVINIITYAIYFIDKWKAEREDYRISERTLLILVCVGGVAGSFFSMQMHNHKTSKVSFILKYIGAVCVFGFITFGLLSVLP